MAKNMARGKAKTRDRVPAPKGGLYRVSVESSFSSAHQLRGFRGQCENLHGHNWLARLALEGGQLDEIGMLVDFSRAKTRLREACMALDHQLLNARPPFDKINPSAEHLARHLAEELSGGWPDGVYVAEVSVWESPGSCASFIPAGVHD